MSSSDEDDTHQCGRCKRSFHSIDEYFTHKKAKTCSKTRVVNDVLCSPDYPTNHSTLHTPKYIPHSNLDAVPSLGISDIISPENSNDNLITTIAKVNKILPKSPTKISWSLQFNDDDDHDDDGDNDNIRDADQQADQQDKTTKRQRGRPKKTSPGTSNRRGRPRKKQMLVCSICSHETCYQKDMDVHMRQVHQLGKRTCVHCRTNFQNKADLNEHLEVCFLNPDNTSSSQHKRCSLRQPLNKHLQEDVLALDDSSTSLMLDEKEVDFSCQECGHLFNNFRQVSEHVNDVHEISPGICQFCGRWFAAKDKLFKHLSTSMHPAVSEGIMHKARERMGPLKILWIKQRHKPSLQAREVKCSKCKSRFKGKQELKQHLEQEHGVVKNFTCETCDYSFSKHRLYLFHLQDAHGIEHYSMELKCPTCGKSFHQKSHVCRHFETLHQPSQQVPDELIHEVEMQPFLPECADDSDIYSCFVCKKQIASLFKMQKHVQHHRVWCLKTPDGILPDATEQLYLNANDINPIPPQDCSSTPLAVLLGMKPIQDNPLVQKGSASVHNLLSKQTSEMQVSNKEIFDKHITDNSPSGKKDLSMPLDLHVASSAEGVTLSIPVATLQSNSNSNALLPSMPLTLTGDNDISDDNSPMPNIMSPQQSSINKQCSTIDQNAFRDLVLSLEEDMNVESILSIGQVAEQPEELPKSRELHTPVSAVFECPSSSEQNTNGNSNTHCLTKSSQAETSDCASNNKTLFICPYCCQSCTSLVEIYEHKLKYHSLVPVFKCISEGCNRIFLTAKDYETHSEVHSQLAFICQTCNDHFDDFQKIISHKTSAHRNMNKAQKKKCDTCEMVFDNHEDFRLHAKTHDKELFVCERCSTAFSSKHQLNVHLESHEEDKQYLCECCGVTFATKAALNKHKLSLTSRHVCQYCQKGFQKLDHLRRHVRSKHTHEKPFKCAFSGCNKAFTRKDKLQEHAKIHSMHKPFTCHYCNKSYRDKAGLKTHEQNHKKEIKYFCTMCESGFIKPSILRNHMSVAHGVELKSNHSYPCHHCGKVFHRPERLKRHMEKEHQVNTEWKYHCALCQQGFPGLASYKTHLSRKHQAVLEVAANSSDNLKEQPDKEKEVQASQHSLLVPLGLAVRPLTLTDGTDCSKTLQLSSLQSVQIVASSIVAVPNPLHIVNIPSTVANSLSKSKKAPDSYTSASVSSATTNVYSTSSDSIKNQSSVNCTPVVADKGTEVSNSNLVDYSSSIDRISSSVLTTTSTESCTDVSKLNQVSLNSIKDNIVDYSSTYNVSASNYVTRAQTAATTVLSRTLSSHLPFSSQSSHSDASGSGSLPPSFICASETSALSSSCVDTSQYSALSLSFPTLATQIIPLITTVPLVVNTMVPSRQVDSLAMGHSSVAHGTEVTYATIETIPSLAAEFTAGSSLSTNTMVSSSNGLPFSGSSLSTSTILSSSSGLPFSGSTLSTSTMVSSSSGLPFSGSGLSTSTMVSSSSGLPFSETILSTSVMMSSSGGLPISGSDQHTSTVVSSSSGLPFSGLSVSTSSALSTSSGLPFSTSTVVKSSTGLSFTESGSSMSTVASSSSGLPFCGSDISSNRTVPSSSGLHYSGSGVGASVVVLTSRGLPFSGSGVSASAMVSSSSEQLFSDSVTLVRPFSASAGPSNVGFTDTSIDISNSAGNAGSLGNDSMTTNVAVSLLGVIGSSPVNTNSSTITSNSYSAVEPTISNLEDRANSGSTSIPSDNLASLASDVYRDNQLPSSLAASLCQLTTVNQDQLAEIRSSSSNIGLELGNQDMISSSNQHAQNSNSNDMFSLLDIEHQTSPSNNHKDCTNSINAELDNQYLISSGNQEKLPVVLPACSGIGSDPGNQTMMSEKLCDYQSERNGANLQVPRSQQDRDLFGNNVSSVWSIQHEEIQNFNSINSVNMPGNQQISSDSNIRSLLSNQHTPISTGSNLSSSIANHQNSTEGDISALLGNQQVSSCNTSSVMGNQHLSRSGDVSSVMSSQHLSRSGDVSSVMSTQHLSTSGDVSSALSNYELSNGSYVNSVLGNQHPSSSEYRCPVSSNQQGNQHYTSDTNMSSVLGNQQYSSGNTFSSFLGNQYSNSTDMSSVSGNQRLVCFGNNEKQTDINLEMENSQDTNGNSISSLLSNDQYPCNQYIMHSEMQSSQEVQQYQNMQT